MMTSSMEKAQYSAFKKYCLQRKAEHKCSCIGSLPSCPNQSECRQEFLEQSRHVVCEAFSDLTNTRFM